MYKLATTSFIKPDTRLNNALFLQNSVDEIELLYFDSKNNYDFPDENEICRLKEIDISYNVHMPIDLDLSLKKSWNVMRLFASELNILKPSTFTIHPIHNKNFYKHLENFSNEFSPVSIENINQNVNIFEIIKGLNVNICFDIGHAILYDLNIFDFVEKFGDKITHIHLHGINKGKDHFDIGFLDKKLLKFIVEFAAFNNVVLCLEIFNEDYFNKSLQILENTVAEIL